MTAGIGSAVAENRVLTDAVRDSLLTFYRTTAEDADMAAPADNLASFITSGDNNLRNIGAGGGFNVARPGCVVDGSRAASNCIDAVTAEFADLYGNFVSRPSGPALNAELSKTGETVDIDTSTGNVEAIAREVRPAVLAYYLAQFPVPAVTPTPAADDGDDDEPWAEAIGGAIALSYFANYLIKRTTWQGQLFTYAMPTSDDTFAYGVQFEPNEDWQMRFSVADSSHAETPADPYYRMQVEYRF